MDQKEKPKKKRGRKPKKDVKVEPVKNKISNNMVIKLNHLNEENNGCLWNKARSYKDVSTLSPFKSAERL